MCISPVIEVISQLMDSLPCQWLSPGFPPQPHSWKPMILGIPLNPPYVHMYIYVHSFIYTATYLAASCKISVSYIAGWWF